MSIQKYYAVVDKEKECMVRFSDRKEAQKFVEEMEREDFYEEGELVILPIDKF